MGIAVVGLDGGQVAWAGGDGAFEDCSGGTFDTEIGGRRAEGEKGC